MTPYVHPNSIHQSPSSLTSISIVNRYSNRFPGTGHAQNESVASQLPLQAGSNGQNGVLIFQNALLNRHTPAAYLYHTNNEINATHFASDGFNLLHHTSTTNQNTGLVLLPEDVPSKRCQDLQLVVVGSQDTENQNLSSSSTLEDSVEMVSTPLYVSCMSSGR